MCSRAAVELLDQRAHRSRRTGRAELVVELPCGGELLAPQVDDVAVDGGRGREPGAQAFGGVGRADRGRVGERQVDTGARVELAEQVRYCGSGSACPFSQRDSRVFRLAADGDGDAPVAASSASARAASVCDQPRAAAGGAQEGRSPGAHDPRLSVVGRTVNGVEATGVNSRQVGDRDGPDDVRGVRAGRGDGRCAGRVRSPGRAPTAPAGERAARAGGSGASGPVRRRGSRRRHGR